MKLKIFIVLVICMININAQIQELDRYIKEYNKSNPLTHSIIIYNDGNILYEHYFNNFDSEKLNNLKSVTKSIISLLIGIAIDKGYIENEYVRVSELLPELFAGIRDKRKFEITIRDLLTMSAGFKWNNLGGKIRSGWDNSENPALYLINNVPLENNPGDKWNYNSGLSHLLSVIITRTSRMSTLEFARKYLFNPLGINDIKWSKARDGIYKGNSELWMKPKDLLKIGIMLLNEGVWENKVIVSGKWIEKSTRKYFDGFEQIGGYGYHWHTRKFGKYNSYLAAGWGGQFLIVIPELKVVVVNTSRWNVLASTYVVFDLIDKFLLNHK
ncbi:serine hydrolase domain-containing protein [Melioribacter sp. OK-6-Me]|uniref:serine hydrolase domain-containing protein n=1 Tax=unclassified Melioribacter TaxID=2627329 RepID=UPI003EDA29B4